jgi:prepilin-type N-terminal cleavage/methylation domain-containing protein
MNSRGFTLVELIVVVLIIGIILAISTLDFGSMQTKGKIEKQTREILSDLVTLRIDAIQRKRRSAAFLGPRQIEFRSYSSNAENVLTQGTIISIKNLPFEIRRLNGGALNVLDGAVDHVEFDTRGYTNDIITIVALPVQVNGGDSCILVDTARANIGRMDNAVTCTAR